MFKNRQAALYYSKIQKILDILSPADGESVLQQLTEKKSPNMIINGLKGSNCHGETFIPDWKEYCRPYPTVENVMKFFATKTSNSFNTPIQRLRMALDQTPEQTELHLHQTLS